MMMGCLSSRRRKEKEITRPCNVMHLYSSTEYYYWEYAVIGKQDVGKCTVIHVHSSISLARIHFSLYTSRPSLPFRPHHLHQAHHKSKNHALQVT